MPVIESFVPQQPVDFDINEMQRPIDGSEMDLAHLERILYEQRYEPPWRRASDMCCDYYDGNQLDAETMELMRQRGIAPLIRNLIGPTVDAVLGIEAKFKRDAIVASETEEGTDVADALTKKLRIAEKQTRMARAKSDAYASQVKAGIGWVEVQRESDPFKAPYRVKAVHRREMFWDWRSREMDLSDARYLIRRKWFDEDILCAMFPQYADVIKQSTRGWAGWDLEPFGHTTMELGYAFDQEQRFSIESMEWRDLERKRLCLYEIWYRIYKRADVIILPNGNTIDFDPKNATHVAAVNAGLVTPENRIVAKMRLAWWAGPHLLADIASPYSHNQFPYVPFWGYKEDRTGVPYGLIRRQMSPQDEINARLSKMMWLLSAKRITMDMDAITGTMTLDQVAQQASSPDAMFMLNPNRRNVNGFSVDSDREMSTQQFAVLQDATKALQDTAGVFNAQMGKETTQQSGVAIANLVEQGSTNLAELNDNYAYASVAVAELLLSYIKEDIGSEPHTVSLERAGDKITVSLNNPMTDEHGQPYVSNCIYSTEVSVSIEDVPSTPTYRAMMLRELTDLTRNLPPEMQSVIIDLIVKASDLPMKDEIVKRLRAITGQGGDPNQQPSPEQQAQAQQAQQQQELAAQAAQLQMQMQQAEIDKVRAETQKVIADTQKAAANTVVDTGSALQDTRHAEAEHGMALDKHLADMAARMGVIKQPQPQNMAA